VNGHLVNVAALEPLFAPHEEPNRHRVRAEREGEPARVNKARRPSPIIIAQNLRSFVKTWRETDYAGASDTTRELLHHWFGRDHMKDTGEGERVPFRYYFCQREAIETVIYLYEVRDQRSLTSITGEYGGPNAEMAALGVNPEDDRWPKYAFKLATGAGKTKVMSLAITWSYFHALRESDSPMAKHFVVIAPNLTVFERLKQDFGNGKIFDEDPLIPVEWKGDWNLSVVLQDEASGAATGGSLYLTNIHRLYDTSKRRGRGEAEMYRWAGPPVSRAKALDTGEALRARVTSHPRVMVLNDEAHHLWDPDSAWNEAITYLHDTIAQRAGGGVVAQLDFSATPKDNQGQIFQHVVCDTPLGEAVDAGIVKTPIIGRGARWGDRAHTDAAERFQEQLMVGYARWQKSKEEWEKSGKKPLMFVMTEDTEAADQIARRLNSDPLFADLNGKTVNLHTNLKGKVKWIGGRKEGYPVFEESESEISDDDLKELRKLSRELDSGQSPYQCIVSVLMLREGWDVKNVTTIVPLRPYTSKANILPEQTLGRGLRRITPPGEAAELVTVVEHPAFVSFYEQQLVQEGLPIEVVDVDDVPRTTVTIFPDEEHKDVAKLDLVLPAVTGGYRRTASLEGLTIDDVKEQFGRYRPLPLGQMRTEEIEYEGRHLITNEVVERMTIRLPLLESGVGAVSFYREELEHATKLRGTHAILAPLLETFLTEILFEEQVSLFDPRLLSRIGDADVREYIRATFVPLILKRTTLKTERLAEGAGVSVARWKPFQVTHSEQHPVLPAARTLFNLVPCNRDLEVAMTKFLDAAQDVAAFCKNAGPQALRVDYSTPNGQLALYTPDFLVRLNKGGCVVVETKGRVDKDVPLKARAAVAWCKAASTKATQWRYLYVPEATFAAFGGQQLETLLRACEPALQDLLAEAVEPQLILPFGEARAEDSLAAFIGKEQFESLPPRYQKTIQQAVALFDFTAKKKDQSYSPVFTPLLGPLDDAATAVLLKFLGDEIPDDLQTQKKFFEPDVSHLSNKDAEFHRRRGRDLQRTLVDRCGMSPIGLLRACLQYAREKDYSVGGVFSAVRRCFAIVPDDVYRLVSRINTFRNDYIAHQNRELSDIGLTKASLSEWITGIFQLWRLHHS
jgi:type III restriction enzyme